MLNRFRCDPQLAQAHFAVAQAAGLAGDDVAALESIRSAQKLRPEWEMAAIFEAQIVQKRSPAEAAKILGNYIEKYPTAREARINYARVLVLDKRFPEARKQFEMSLARMPKRALSLLGLARSADRSGDHASAVKAYRELLEIWKRADPGLPELAEARKAVARP